jgi:YVTN family beta-propeller protein
VTNRIYVADQGSGDVIVIDGSNNTPGAPITAGTNPSAIAVNAVSNKIYVANNVSSNITVIDGASNNSNTTNTINAGTAPLDVAVNPATGKIYVVNNGSSNVTTVTEQQVQSIALTTAIAPVLGTNQFTFTTSSTFSPNVPTVQNVYFQFDSWQGAWLRATGSAPNFTGGPPQPLLPGIHVVYAYAADSQFADSMQPGGSGFGQSSPIAGAMAAFLFLVVPQSSNTALVSSATPSVFGQPVTFTVTVTSDNFGTPSGTVTFTDGATMLGTVALGNTGQAMLSISTLTLGTHTIQASYSGDASFLAGGSSPVSQTVNKAASSPVVTLTGGSNPSAVGQPLTFTAIVNPQFTGTPTGQVTFLDNFNNQLKILPGSPVNLDGSAHASLTVSSLAIGTHNISVVYNGDVNFDLNSSPNFPQVVKATSGTGINLTAGTSPASAGDSLTFTAAVFSSFAGTPTGTVTFVDAFDSSTLGGGPIPLNGSAQASVTTSALVTGIHHITATYNGDGTFLPSTSSPITEVVLAVAGNPSTTALTVNNGGSTTLYFGFVAGVAQSATFAVTVTGSNDGDSVALMQGSNQIGPVLTLSSGTASFATQLSPGVHNIRAVYLGNGTSAGSISSAVTVSRSPRPRINP